MKQLKITVNGKSYDVQVEELGAAAPVQAAASAPVAPAAAPATAPAPAPAAPAAAGEGNAIEAPMSGTVLKIPVKAGQAVKRGDVLLILEAMKMENEIFAPNDGTVTSVNVSNGETVEAGKVLMYLK